MPVCKLNDTTVAGFSCPAGRTHIEYFDTLIRGLYVDVLASERMSYRVRYRQDKKQRIHTLGDARLLTVNEAREQARLVLRKVLAGGDPKSSDLLAEGLSLESFFIGHYLPYVKSYKRSWATDETMIRIHLLPALGDQAMGSIIAPDIARVVEAMKISNYAPATINRLLILLRYGYALAMRWEMDGIDRNPAKEIKDLRCDNKIERYLTSEQASRLIAAARASLNPALADITILLLLTGARLREALDAKWQDINWRQNLWRIPKTKAGKVRHVPLSRKAQKTLKARLEQHDPTSAYIFPNPQTGKPFTSIFFSWNSARKAAQLPELRLHDLRHSFASFLVNAGRSLYEVQELLGHADIRTTSRYAHLSPERLREAVEVVSFS